MLGTQSIREQEYAALMDRTRDVARNALMCWTAAALTSMVLLAGAISARSPGRMLPVVLCAAFGYYVTLRARREARLIDGYLQESFEKDRDGAQWYTRQSQLHALPTAEHGRDWLPLVLAHTVTLPAMAFAWLYAGAAVRGEFMAGLATVAGVAFAVHSVMEHVRVEQVSSGVYWTQVTGGLREVPPTSRRAASS